ncbi:MAG: ABC transporter permease [Anaerolineae bacterium]|nr:ABC transporter permease [Anaerolineae bacterium]
MNNPIPEAFDISQAPSTREEKRGSRSSAVWHQFKRDWRVLMTNPVTILGVVLIAIFGLMAISYPLLRATVLGAAFYDPITGFDFAVLHPSPPGPGHLLGTDSLGHDVLSMLLAATQPAFLIGLAASLTTAVISTLMGVTAAYFGGFVDNFLVHIADAFLLLPAPIFMVIVGMRFQDLGPVQLGLIYGVIAGAGSATIVMRSQALLVVARPFIEAARIAGGSSWHIIRVHVLPHMLPLAALYMMLSVTGAVVSDGFISFFGFSRNYLNWGTMIYSSFVYSSSLGTGTEWHVLLPPSLALSLFAAAFYFVSRGLHQLADPRLRTR